MTQLRAYPYLRPRADRLRVTTWLYLAGTEVHPLPERLEHWDPGLDLNLQALLEIDLDGIRADCRLEPTDPLRLVLLWLSPGTGLRGRGNTLDLPAEGTLQDLTLELQVDGAALADRLRMEVQLILAGPGQSTTRLAPRRAGSILWQVERSLLLEGKGARFPSELIDFETTTWLPSEAGWYLDWDPEDLTLPVLGGFRLLLNSRNERIQRAVSILPSPEPAIQELIRFDVGRTMIMTALASKEFLQHHATYGEGTVGEALRRLIHTFFPSDSLLDLAQERDRDPLRFECRLQATLQLLK